MPLESLEYVWPGLIGKATVRLLVTLCRCSRVFDKETQDQMSDQHEKVVTMINDKCRKVNQVSLIRC